MAKQYSTKKEALEASKGKGVHKMPNGKWMVGRTHPKSKSKAKPKKRY